MTFITPAQQHTATDLIVKKSRFIGHVVPIKSVEEAEAALASIQTLHKSANHNCYAYTVGLGVPVERFSDDGEPSGTAGRPILEVLRRRGISNVLVVVTRYFGGTLLGANGLVRAYADTTVHALDETPMLACQQMHRVDILCGYGQFGKVEYELTQLGYTMLNKEFGADVSFSILAQVDAVDGLCEKLADWSSGQVHTVVQPAEYVGISPDGQFVYGVWDA